MALVQEDGTGVEDANSYVTEDIFDTYTEDRELEITGEGDTEAALIRATAAIDGAYRGGFPGYRTFFRDQNLEWPRTAAYDYEGNLIGGNEIPQEILDAVCEAAVRELNEPGSMAPDLERGGFIRSIRAGSVGIDYGGNQSTTTFTTIDNIMARIVGNSNPSYVGRASRG